MSCALIAHAYLAATDILISNSVDEEMWVNVIQAVQTSDRTKYCSEDFSFPQANHIVKTSRFPGQIQKPNSKHSNVYTTVSPNIYIYCTYAGYKFSQPRTAAHTNSEGTLFCFRGLLHKESWAPIKHIKIGWISLPSIIFHVVSMRFHHRSYYLLGVTTFAVLAMQCPYATGNSCDNRSCKHVPIDEIILRQVAP